LEILLAQSSQTPGGGGLAQFLPFILIFLIIYFLMIRPQTKRQKEKRQMLENLKKGDHVVTSGGIYGKITRIIEKDSILVLSIDKNVSIHVSKSAIANLVPKSSKDKEK